MGGPSKRIFRLICIVKTLKKREKYSSNTTVMIHIRRTGITGKNTRAGNGVVDLPENVAGKKDVEKVGVKEKAVEKVLLPERGLLPNETINGGTHDKIS